ncbi:MULTISPECIES: DUF488 domain-containing protein [Chitinophagaceae]
MKTKIKIKRAYLAASEEDGFRVLVDRLWPRGISKEELKINEWAKELAPSTELREWYGHLPERWDEFQKEYWTELEKNAAVDAFVQAHKKSPVITLIFAAKDAHRANAVVLQQFLLGKFT